MSLFSSLGALELGLIYGLVAMGVFISFRVLRFPDLTVDGTFATGGAVSALLVSSGYDPFLASAAAMLVCGFAGMITGWLNVKLGIMDLLASILMMTALYSINLRIMGGPNIPLITSDTVFTLTQPAAIDDFVWRPALLFIVVIVAKVLIDAYFSTRSGLAMRSTGSNLRMARAQGVSTGRMVLIGMALSNALVGLGGAMFAQSQGGSDISMGIGTIVIGLAAVIVGESILPARRFLFITLAVIVGAILYRFFIALALNSDFIGLKAQDLNLITALLVAIALILPKLRRNLRFKGRA
ncbi:ABC transporter permease [Advenella sp. S44]|uniref:ABC transporter permease n=1 Tax=Advenella sp. S44 TaxID=1982755 RepID=UPI000C29E78E|nr:ABC transporter permease [Advenella sp. S44]PJX23744.1 ABC transporter permease [Advenella sp. S44]